MPVRMSIAVYASAYRALPFESQMATSLDKQAILIQNVCVRLYVCMYQTESFSITRDLHDSHCFHTSQLRSVNLNTEGDMCMEYLDSFSRERIERAL